MNTKIILLVVAALLIPQTVHALILPADAGDYVTRRERCEFLANYKAGRDSKEDYARLTAMKDTLRCDDLDKDGMALLRKYWDNPTIPRIIVFGLDHSQRM